MSDSMTFSSNPTIETANASLSTPNVSSSESLGSNHPDDKLIRRMISFKNPFDVLHISKTETLENIQKKYKKLALIVHPDKCNHPRAEEAFHALKKALKLLENEENRKRYSELMDKAEARVLEEWNANGSMDVHRDQESFRLEVQKMTQRLIIELELQCQRADEMRLANERFEKDIKQRAETERKRRDEEETLWEEGRTFRVESWRSFVEKSRSQKRLKTFTTSASAGSSTNSNGSTSTITTATTDTSTVVTNANNSTADVFATVSVSSTGASVATAITSSTSTATMTNITTNASPSNVITAPSPSKILTSTSMSAIKTKASPYPPPPPPPPPPLNGSAIGTTSSNKSGNRGNYISKPIKPVRKLI